MQNFLKVLGIGNILTILTIVFTSGAAWSKINSTVDEFKTLRNLDIARIEKIEIRSDVLSDRITMLEKNEMVIKNDLSYIKQSIDEVKKMLQDRVQK